MADRCDNCGKELNEQCFYVVGQHTFVCNEVCYQEQIEFLIQTFHQLPSEEGGGQHLDDSE